MYRLTRHIKEAFFGLIRHGGMTFSSVLAVTITLTLMSFFLMISMNVRQITQSVQGEVQIHVSISNVFDTESIQGLGDQIEILDGVSKVTFSDKDQELDKFIASYGAEGSIFEMYRGEKNPLKNAYIVEVKEGSDIKLITEQIRVFVGVDKADYGGENTIKLIRFMNGIRDVGLILVIILSSLAIFLIANTIKITIQSRLDEISILRTLGATNSFIRAPMVLEGLTIGFMGSLFPIVLTVYGYEWLYKLLGGFMVSELFVLRPVYPFVLQISYLLAILGVVVGLIGSFISVTRYLHMKR
ncbi:MAG: ABC transporter permease [Erysipelotrichaceae bacterium]|jgi:cell division transport system permease protein|nr:ABC transporter permease [Erysipelotrichaceae bacterium]